MGGRLVLDGHRPTRLSSLVLLREDVASDLIGPLGELIDSGHPLVLATQTRPERPPFAVGDGVGLYGEAGIFPARSMLAVFQRLICKPTTPSASTSGARSRRARSPTARISNSCDAFVLCVSGATLRVDGAQSPPSGR